MHFVVKNTPPPIPQSVMTAKLFPIMDQPAQDKFQRVNLEPEDLEDETPVEAKVVKARRGRRPVAPSEVAETK